jgi:hypothetical protein
MSSGNDVLDAELDAGVKAGVEPLEESAVSIINGE